MKIKCGTDIIEIERIKKAITDKNINFAQKIFTEKEINYCENKKNAKYQHYAVRFAAKEAVYKVISELLDNRYDLDWKDIEIRNKNNGAPFVLLTKQVNGLEDIEISMSHCKQYAVANVVAQISK